jgi:5'-nucleotidase
VAAAIEGSIMGVPSMAVSMANYEPRTPMARAARFVAKLVASLDKLGLNSSTFLNVNLPLDIGQAYRSFEFTTLGSRRYKDIVIRKTDPRGKPYYSRGVVSITPTRLNFTDADVLARLMDSRIKL